MNSKLFKLSTLVMSFMVINIYGIIRKCYFRQIETNINRTRGIAQDNFKEESDRTNIENLLDRLIIDLEEQVKPDSKDCPEYQQPQLSDIENIEATLRHSNYHGQSRSDREQISNLLNKLNVILKQQ